MAKLDIIRRSAIAILACTVLIAAATACFGGDDSTEADLQRVDQLASSNLIEMEVLKARITRLEEINETLSDRIAQMEGENKELTHRVAVLEEIGATVVASLTAAGSRSAAPAAAQPSGLGAAYDAASDEDRQMVREFLECAMKASGTDATTIAAMLPESEKMTWRDIEDGGQTIENIQILRDIVCSR